MVLRDGVRGLAGHDATYVLHQHGGVAGHDERGEQRAVAVVRRVRLEHVGSAEVFRDETVPYASRLWESGVQAELHVWPGGVHGFTTMVPHAALSRAAVAALAGWTDRLLAR